MLEKLSTHWRYLLLGPTILTTFLTPFLRFNHIPLLSAESLLTYLFLVVVGLLLGSLMIFGGTLVQVFFGAFFIALFAFYQMDNLPELPFGLRYMPVLLAFSTFLSLGLYFLRKHLEQFLFIVFGVLWLGAFFQFIPPIEKSINLEAGEQVDASLPPYIHIILDEHIGIEGIPSSVNQGQKFSKELLDKYTSQGFRVFGRAYSRTRHTRPSFASFLNFKPTYDSLPSVRGAQPMIKLNGLFEKLTRQGYIINVFESTDFPYCDQESGYRFGKCISYRINMIFAANSSIAILSGLLETMKVLYRFNEVALAFGFPKLEKTKSVLPITAMKTFYKNIDFLSEGKRGNAYFIHLFVPHSPYIFDEKCSIRFPKEWEWRSYLFNREGYYQDHLKQVKCSHKMMDDLLSKLNSRSTNSNGTIIIQGDHGSRIDFLGRKAPFTTGQYIQDFSTFFAVRSQKHNSGYDRRPIALDELTRSVIFGMKPLPEIGQSKFVCPEESGGVY